MKIITKIFNVYKFDELTDEQKERVISNYYDINVDYDWWQYVYDDAKKIGLKIKDFDLDRDNYCKIEKIDSCYEIAQQILKNHGETCETYKDAKKFIEKWDQLVINCSNGIDLQKVSEENYDKFDEKVDELENEFLYNLSEDYKIMLQNEYDYLISSRAIIETLVSNDYDFTEEGNIY